MDYIRASREPRHALIISDPQPVGSVAGDLGVGRPGAPISAFSSSCWAGVLYFGGEILLPILIAAVVSLTLAPLIKAGARHGISPWISSLLIVALAVGALALAATALAGPVSEWIGRAPQIGATIKQKLRVLEPPLAALRELQTSLFGGGVSAPRSTGARASCCRSWPLSRPAVGELMLFFGTLLFFLVGQIGLRNRLVLMFSHQEARLRLAAHHQRYRKKSCRLPRRCHDDQRRARPDRRGRRVACRPARSGDFRPARRAPQLRALCRAGDHDGHDVRRRAGDIPLARPRADRAGRAAWRYAPWKDISSRPRSSAGGLRSTRSSWCWRWRSGPGCGDRSARFSPCRCPSSVSLSSATCFRMKTSNCRTDLIALGV